MGAIEIPQNARFQCVQIAVITRKIGYHYNTKELVKNKTLYGLLQISFVSTRLKSLFFAT